jgi:membrane protease YdiL (CAAX protease family)
MVKRFPPSQAALAEIVVLFLPSIPAYLWMWPAVEGTRWLPPFQIVVYLYFLAGTLFIGLRRWKLDELGLKWQGVWLTLLCGLALAVGRMLVLLSINLPLHLPAFNLNLIGDIFYYFALVGLIEELLFRGLIYRAVEDWRGTRWAFWVTAVAFGLYHIGGGPGGVLGGLIFGMIYGAIRQRTGSILGLIIIHGLDDLASVEIAPTLNNRDLFQVTILHPGLTILGYLFIIAVAIYLWKMPARSAS